MENSKSKENKAKIHPANDAEEQKPSIGIITGCHKLNLREKPSLTASVLMTIPALAEVAVDVAASTDSFYKVCTVAGIEGFCVKKFITIRK